jgi:hypothetical protein
MTCLMIDDPGFLQFQTDMHAGLFILFGLISVGITASVPGRHDLFRNRSREIGSGLHSHAPTIVCIGNNFFVSIRIINLR